MALCLETLSMLEEEFKLKNKKKPFGLYLIRVECDLKNKKNEREVFNFFLKKTVRLLNKSVRVLNQRIFRLTVESKQKHSIC
jgi:hypothetical protein